MGMVPLSLGFSMKLCWLSKNDDKVLLFWKLLGISRLISYFHRGDFYLITHGAGEWNYWCLLANSEQTLNFGLLTLCNCHTHWRLWELNWMHFYYATYRCGPHRLIFEQVYGGKWEECGVLKMLGLGSGNVRRCGLVRESVSLWKWAFRASS